MPAHQVRLTKALDEFVERQLESGKYEDVSEVLRAGLRLLERQTREEERKLEILRALAAEATAQLDRGEGILIRNGNDLEQFFASLESPADVNE